MLPKEITDERWTELASVSSYTTPFHHTDWMRLVCRALGGSLTLYECEVGEVAWLIPAYSGAPWSREGFATSSVGYGGPLPVCEGMACDIYRGAKATVTLLERARAEPCTRIVTFPLGEWRDAIAGPFTVQTYLTQVLSLSSTRDVLFNNELSGKVRTAVRRATAAGVSIERLSLDSAAEGLQLLAQTQRAVGASYVTDAMLFDELVRGRAGARAYAARAENELVSIAVMLVGYRRAFHLLHGWNRQFAGVCANQLLLWRMITDAQDDGAIEVDLGRSHYPTLFQAKARWGTRAVPVLACNQRADVEDMLRDTRDAGRK